MPGGRRRRGARAARGRILARPREQVGVRAEPARALATLREADRELVLLVAWEGLSLEEAAAALGCRRGTAAVRLYRARRRLRAELTDDAPLTMIAVEHG